MKYQPFKVEVLAKTDVTESAWLTSKPTIKYNNQSELDSAVFQMRTQDLPLSAFIHFDLKITSSIGFRDLLFCIRPCIAWASSFRILPINDDTITMESNPVQVEYSDDHMESIYERVRNGEKLDSVKKSLYLGTMTSYVLSIDSRTLRCICNTLRDLDEPGLEYQIVKFECLVGPTNNLKSAPSLYPKLALTDKDASLSIKDSRSISSRKNKYTVELLVHVDVSIGSQFIRQHFSKIRSSLFNYIKKYGYASYLGLTCSDRFTYYVCADLESITQLISRRICHVAQFDWDDRDSWSFIIKELLKHYSDSELTTREFAKLLPCRCNYRECTVDQETRLRLWSNKGKDMLPDEGIPCPILVGDPSNVGKRINALKSNSMIADYWVKLVEEGFIKYQPTKWTNENERAD